MKKMILLFTLLSTTLFAHGDHEHGPNAIQAPKGGVIRSLEEVHLELVHDTQGVKIYVYDKNVKPVQTQLYPVSATVTLPKKKPEPVKITEAGDHWQALVNSQGAHRYTFELSIKQDGHNDKVKWVIEPKKK